MCFSVIAEVSECPQASSCGAGRFVFKRHGLIDRAFPPWTWAVLAERPTFFAAISKDAPIVLRTPNHHAFGGELSACSKSALQKTQLYFVRRSATYCDATSASHARPSQPSLGVSSLDLGRSHAGRPLFWELPCVLGPDFGPLDRTVEDVAAIRQPLADRGVRAVRKQAVRRPFRYWPAADGNRMSFRVFLR